MGRQQAQRSLGREGRKRLKKEFGRLGYHQVRKKQGGERGNFDMCIYSMTESLTGWPESERTRRSLRRQAIRSLNEKKSKELQ